MSAPEMRKAPAERGLAWIKEGSDLLYRLRRSMWVPALVLLAVTYLTAIPFLGLIAAFLSPLVLAGIMRGLDQVRHDDSVVQLPGDAVFSIFSVKGAAARIIGMILLLGIAVLVVLLFAFGALGIDLNQIDLTQGTLDADSLDLSGANWLAFFLILLVGTTPLLMLGYFAMPRIALDGSGLVDAMTSSFRAFLKNWASLAVFFLMLFFVLLAFGAVIGILALLVGIAAPTELAASLVNVLMLPLQILLNLILLCAQYIMYRDIFPVERKEISEPPEPMQDAAGSRPESGDEDQFKA